MVFLDPIIKNSREMERNAELRIFIEQLQEREIRFVIGVFDDPAKVTDRLVIMYPEAKFDLLQNAAFQLLSKSLTANTLR